MSSTSVSIQVRIFGLEAERGVYPVEAALDDGRKYEGELRLNKQVLLALELNPQAYGLALFEALFSGRIRDAYSLAIGRADALADGQLRVQLWIDKTAGELQHEISWERLYDSFLSQPRPLAASAATPFSRYISLATREPDLVSERPIRILVAVANPTDLPEGMATVRVAEEIADLDKVMGELRRKKQIEVTWMPGQTGLPEDLRARLDQPGYTIRDEVTSLGNIVRYLPGHHGLHFIGHGAYQSKKDRAVLYLEKESGDWQAVDDSTIAEKLGNIRPLPRLVFLVACESARAESQETFVGLGPKLVQADIPAVVAMRERVAMDDARQLTADFYRRLLDHGEVDRALNEARNLLLTKESTSWTIPVLFMRLRQGRLFSAQAGPKEGQAEPDKPVVEGKRLYKGGRFDLPTRTRIRNNLTTGFNLSELKNICMDLGIDHENFPNEINGFTRELFLYCERRGMEADLVEIGRAQRPELDW